MRFRQFVSDGDEADSHARPRAGAGGRSGAEVRMGDWVSSRVRDLGVGGAFVATYRSMPVGTELEVEVDLAGANGPVTMRAEVRWLAEPDRLPAGVDAGMGLAFASLEVETLLALSEYLAGLGEPAVQ